MIEFSCDCGKSYTVKDESAGRQGKCKECDVDDGLDPTYRHCSGCGRVAKYRQKEVGK